MCGRDAAFYTWKEIWAFSQPLCDIFPSEDPPPRYNRAPSQQGWVLAGDADGGTIAREMRWGLIPMWAKDAKVGYSMINARVETAPTKPAFRSAWKSRRCLVPSSGYFEWRGLPDGKTKQPFFIRNAEAPILMFAGLWERWKNSEGELLETYSIVTQPAHGDVEELHDRMPLMLPPALLRDWIHGTPEDAAAIALAAHRPLLTYYPVSTAVGNVRNQGPQLVAPLAEPAEG